MNAYARKTACRLAGRAAAGHLVRNAAARAEPAFAGTAIVILAVGIGACTAMFSIVQAVLLRPFAVNAPDRVVMIWGGNTRHQAVGELTYLADRDLRAIGSFEKVALVSSVNWWGTISLAGGEPLGMPVSVVSATFFDVLGARPLLGRTFRAEDDSRSAPPVLILSHAIWTQQFGRDPNVIGRTVMVREEAPAEPFEIVGVMPEEFFFPRGAKYWTPAAPRLARNRASPGRLYRADVRAVGCVLWPGPVEGGRHDRHGPGGGRALYQEPGREVQGRPQRRTVRCDADSHAHLRPGSTGAVDAHGGSRAGAPHRLFQCGGAVVRARRLEDARDGRPCRARRKPRRAHAPTPGRERPPRPPRRVRRRGGCGGGARYARRAEPR